MALSAVALVGMKGEAAKLTAEAMTRNWTNSSRLGCSDKEGLANMHKGESPKIQRGPYKCDELSVEHIIPKFIVPELDKVIANLEFLPPLLHQRKGDRIAERQVSPARNLNAAWLLSDAGLQIVLRKR